MKHVVLALLLVVSCSQGNAQDNLATPPQQPQSQPAQPAPAVEQQRTEPDYYKVSCERPKDHDAADLCEQRRMAKAAEDAVWWARLQAWLGLFGLGGILITLIFTGIGTRAAARQVRLGRHALVDTERAFIYPKETLWSAAKDLTDKVRCWLISVRWQNTGKTPTRHLRIFTNVAVRPDPFPEDFEFGDLGTGQVPTVIAPGGMLETTQLMVTIEQMEAIIDGGQFLYVWGWAEYDDVFEGTRRHRTEFCHRWFVGGNPRRPERCSMRYEVHNRYNGADDECEGALRTVSPKDMGDR